MDTWMTSECAAQLLPPAVSFHECVRSPQLILDAQCQATRDAQIQEKRQIQAELVEEEKRLDAMMEVERHKAVETEKQIDELRKHQRIR